MEQHRTIEIDGHTVHYRDEGRNNTKTVVLLHGFMQSLDVWSSYVLTYMSRFRVVTIDLPGHGHTDTFGEIHTMNFMAKVVRDVLNNIGVERCVMIGHSMGGYVALAFADLFPHALRGLGLVNSHAMADSEEKRTSREEVCRQVLENKALFVVDFIPRLFSKNHSDELSQEIKYLNDQCLETSTDSIIAAQLGMARRPSRIGVLEELEVPVLLVYGKDDERIPPELAVAQALIPHRAEMLMLDKTGHMSFLEEREYVKTRIANFVDTCY